MVATRLAHVMDGKEEGARPPLAWVMGVKWVQLTQLGAENHFLSGPLSLRREAVVGPMESSGPTDR